MHLAPHDTARFEAIAFRAWPAATVLEHRGMLLRSTGGDSRRANSAAVFACQPALGLGEIVATGEAFYRERGQVPRFHLGPTAPAGLDEKLAALGYAIEAPVHFQTVALDALLSYAWPAAPHVRVEISTAPDPHWVDVQVTRGRYAPIASTFLALLERLAPRAGFATAHTGGEPAGACLLVQDGDVVIVEAVRTLPEARRRGVARCLLHAGARWAKDRGAAVVCLQVDTDNDGAIALYQATGFVTRYGCHYRVAAVGGHSALSTHSIRASGSSPL